MTWGSIHNNLCNNIHTENVMNELKKLILQTNEYMWTHTTTNCVLLKSIATYITHIIDIFGLNSTSIDHIGFTSDDQ